MCRVVCVKSCAVRPANLRLTVRCVSFTYSVRVSRRHGGIGRSMEVDKNGTLDHIVMLAQNYYIDFTRREASATCHP